MPWKETSEVFQLLETQSTSETFIGPDALRVPRAASRRIPFFLFMVSLPHGFLPCVLPFFISPVRSGQYPAQLHAAPLILG